MGTKGFTVEEQWQQYRKMCWGHVSETSPQCAIMKQVFFSAWFDSMVTMRRVVGDPEMSDDDGAELLNKAEKEVMLFIENEIKEGLSQWRNQ